MQKKHDGFTAMQTFMIRVADTEQRAFIKKNWDMAHGTIPGQKFLSLQYVHFTVVIY